MTDPWGTDKLAVKRRELVEYVAPSLQEGETVTAVLAAAGGPLPPFIPLVPVFGVAAMLTRWFRVYGLVVTNRRFFLVRRRKIGSGRLGSLDVVAPLASTEVVRWQARPSYGTLNLRAEQREFRLHVSGMSAMDVPNLLAALPSSHLDGSQPDIPPRTRMFPPSKIFAFGARVAVAVLTGWVAVRHPSGVGHWILLLLSLYWTLRALLTLRPSS